MDDVKLIELVELYPELYDLSHPEYLNIRQKERNWSVIGKQLLKDPEQCKRRWSNIRDNYRKNLQKRKARGILPGQSAPKKYRYENQLHFLTEFFSEKERAMKTSPPVSDNNEDDDDISTEMVEEDPLAVLAQTNMVRVRPYVNPASRYQRTEAQANRSIDTFLASIGTTLKGLSPYYQNVAKSRIFEVVQNLELEQIVQGTHDSVSSSPTPSVVTSEPLHFMASNVKTEKL